MSGRLFLLTLFLAVLAPPGQAATYLVLPDGSGDFPTIQAAVGFASPGDIIELGDGVFMGTGNRDVAYLGKGLTIRSQSGIPEFCIIDCQASTDNPHRGFLFHGDETDAAVLEGVTIRHASEYWGGGIHLMGQNTCPQIRHCIFQDNHSPDSEGGGICCESDAHPLIVDCRFFDNSAACGGGLSVTNGWGITGPEVRGCTFYNNVATTEGGGVRL